jgi:hypothetical protein
MSAALVNYPGIGSLWLEHARIEGGFVVGGVRDPHALPMCDAFSAPPQLMNFPVTCIRKWENGGTE